MSMDLTLERLQDSYTNGRLAVAHCPHCEAQQAFPTPTCFQCGRGDLNVVEHSGTGSVYSWVVNHFAFDRDRKSPYTVLLVELQGGARVYGNLADDDAVREQLRAGQPVSLDVEATRASGQPVFRLQAGEALPPTLAGAQVAPALTSYRLVQGVARRLPEKTAFQLIGYQIVSYRDLVARVDRCAGRLAAEGVGPGDRVAVMAENRIEVLELWLACNRLGAAFVPMNPAMRGPILKDMLDLANARLAFCEPDWKVRLSEAAPDLRCIDIAPLKRGVLTDWGQHEPGAVSDDPDALTIIMFTSGTTGRSKGVMWSSTMANTMATSLATMMQFEASDRLHTALPLFHGNALILSVLLALGLGATAVVSRKFSVSRFADELEQSGATATSFLGSMTHMVLSKPLSRPFRGALLKALVIPAPPAIVLELSARFGCICASAYGLADAGLMLFTGLTFPEGTCGRAYEPLWDARAIDAQWQEMPLGMTGELAVRPRVPGIASQGYWRMPEVTAETRRDGWIRTGDLVRQDAGGWFTFVDRAKDAIRRRGENVSSQELEQVFSGHPAVEECAAYPVPSEMVEDEIMIAVVRRTGHDVTAEELIRFAEPKLPYFAVPRFIRFVDELPRNAMAKVLKAELRKQGIVPGSWDLSAAGYEVKR